MSRACESDQMVVMRAMGHQQMDKALASQILDRILAAERELGALSDLSEEISDDQERRALRRHLAEAMNRYTDILMSIVRQYPDLDPDKNAT
jgi:hypothetical protein